MIQIVHWDRGNKKNKLGSIFCLGLTYIPFTLFSLFIFLLFPF